MNCFIIVIDGRLTHTWSPYNDNKVSSIIGIFILKLKLSHSLRFDAPAIVSFGDHWPSLSCT